MPSPGQVVPLIVHERDDGPQILVVDDSPANLMAFEVVLGDLGGRVVQASSGEEALRILLDHDFALILLDVMMPELDGFETARLIRERKRSRHTPIIFITAHSRDDQAVLEAYQLGAVDFLFKPFEADVLRAKAAVFMDLQRRTAEVARQARQLREHERREHEHSLDEQRRRWEEDSVRRRMDELAEEARRKDDFLALLGHELRNPLTPILAGLQLLQRSLAGKEVDPLVHRTRDRVERQVEHLRRLVDDLLDVSRISSGKVELRKAPVSLRSIVEDAVAITRPAIEAARHELVIALPDPPPTLSADAVRLTQVFANLLSNGANYTDPGGRIELRGSTGDGWVEIAVIDNGRGIPAELLPRIFDMYTQERSGSGGLGLGLAVARRLVELHGGSIQVRSEGPGRGSELVVRLLHSEEPEESEQPIAAAASGAGPVASSNGPLVVAVVDDNLDLRDGIAELLALVGHTVEVAKDGQSGVDLVLRQRPDVALIDISMPDMDGYAVAVRLRQELGEACPRLVAMSGHGLEGHRRRAREAGFHAYLIKPCPLEELEKTLRR
jgi:two-component system, sensor histidine kinase